MNLVVLIGRLTKDPDVRYSSGDKQTCIARFTLAVDRRFKKEGEQAADFISCVAFGKTGEFCEKYAKKGKKFVVSGRIQTGSYKNKEGQNIYTTDVVVSDIEFGEGKGSEPNENTPKEEKAADGFVNVPDEVDSELPFN